MWELDRKKGWVPENWCLWIRCWRRLLRVLWPARRSNQSVLKEINPEYSLERLMLKLKLQYFGHMMWRVGSLERTLMLGKIEGGRRRGDRGWGGWIASLTQWAWIWASSGRSWRTGKPGMLQSLRWRRVRHDWATEQQQNPETSRCPRLALTGTAQRLSCKLR